MQSTSKTTKDQGNNHTTKTLLLKIHQQNKAFLAYNQESPLPKEIQLAKHKVHIIEQTFQHEWHTTLS